MSETLVRMPKLADTLVEGTLGAWLKRVGETVRAGEPLASIETDKVTTELGSPAAGQVLELLVEPGQTVPIDTPIARIGARSDAPSPAEALEPAPPAAAPPETPRAARLPKITPVAARLLAEHGLSASDFATRSARLTKEDVLAFVARRERAAPPPPAVGPRGDVAPLTSMRRAIAEHMLKARQTIPHGQSVIDVDLTQLVAWRDAQKATFERNEGAKLTFTVLFVHALARQLSRHLQSSVDIGVAVALDAGLIVPVVRRADALGLAETARSVADLAPRARSNRLAPDATQGAQMTLTNVGSFGNLTASPIVPLSRNSSHSRVIE